MLQTDFFIPSTGIILVFWHFALGILKIMLIELLDAVIKGQNFIL